jgi:PAS domain S-box-containing protein
VSAARPRATPKNEASLEAMLLRLPVAAFVLGKDSVVRVWNPVAESTLGWTAQECVGSALPGLDAEQKARVEGAVRKADSGPVTGLKVNWPHKSGRVVPVSIGVGIFEEKHMPEGLTIGTVLDLTAIMTLEEQLRMSQKMESVGLLAGGIAHDFNNLLTVIGGYSQLLLANPPDLSPEKKRKGLEEILAAARRAGDLTRQLLAFSQRQTLQPRPVDLNILITGFVKMLERLLGEHIEIVLRLDNRPCNAIADPSQMEQVLLNLAINARDAMQLGGTLEIETGHVVFTSADSIVSLPPGTYIRLVVRDTGTGITSEVKEHLFEPFFTTKKHGEGAGLGLSTVYGIVRQSAGEVAVETEVGRGSAFIVYLPASSAVVEPPIRDMVSASRGMGTILVCDDEEVVGQLISAMLTRMGYKVLVASSAAEAMKLARENQGEVALLLTDMIMPDTDGAELALELRKLSPDTKVLFMSGHSEPDQAIGSGGLQDAAFLQKPFTVEALSKKVRELLPE